MEKDRVILKKSLDTFEDVNIFFQKLSGIDPSNVPEKYGDGVEKAAELVKNNLEIGIVYKCDDISHMTEESVILTNSEVYSGGMPPCILKDSKQVISFVVTLCGYKELSTKVDDIMADYFMDTWGSAYVECAQSWLAKTVLEHLKSEGMSRTHLWSPGQHNFSIQNQKTLFEILKPEDVGCVLTKNFMMQPVKSASGIMGIITPDVTDLLLPCDFCSFAKNCPASKRGCAEF